MRVINIIEVVDNVIQGVESFGVFDEKLVNEVSAKAEDLFIAKLKENDVLDEDDDNFSYFVENGFYNEGGYSVSITWSDI